MPNFPHRMILNIFLFRMKLRCFLSWFAVCSVVGQFLADPTTRCRYLECSYGSDPWPDVNGVIPLIQVPRLCAPGTAVPIGYIGGRENPCTSGAAECKRKTLASSMTRLFSVITQRSLQENWSGLLH